MYAYNWRRWLCLKLREAKMRRMKLRCGEQSLHSSYPGFALRILALHRSFVLRIVALRNFRCVHEWSFSAIISYNWPSADGLELVVGAGNYTLDVEADPLLRTLLADIAKALSPPSTPDPTLDPTPHTLYDRWRGQSTDAK